jgi:hypothetical protein
MLVELAQDQLYAECFDQAIPRTKQERPEEERVYNKMDVEQFQQWKSKPNHKRGKS